MAYENGKTYWICPINNTGVALSVYGYSQVSQNRNVFLYTKQDVADQLWHLELGDGFARLKSDLNQSYALNIYLGTSNYNNCDIHTWADNVEDSKINFRTIDASNNTYRIQNYRYDADNDLYLTAKGTTSESDVVWAKSDGGNLQVWKLIEKTSGGSSKGNYLIYPTKVMNITQSYTGSYSHNSNSTGDDVDYPIDENCGSSGRSYIYCPCDKMVIRKIYGVNAKGTNTIWLESTSPVIMPCGTDYVTMMVIHPNDDTLKNLYVGQTFSRKQAMFLEGNDGDATGYHFHISLGKGTMSGDGWKKNNKGSWVLTTTGVTIKPEQGFYIDRAFTTVSNSNGLSFKYLP